MSWPPTLSPFRFKAIPRRNREVRNVAGLLESTFSREALSERWPLLRPERSIDIFRSTMKVGPMDKLSSQPFTGCISPSALIGRFFRYNVGMIIECVQSCHHDRFMHIYVRLQFNYGINSSLACTELGPGIALGGHLSSFSHFTSNLLIPLPTCCSRPGRIAFAEAFGGTSTSTLS